MSETKFSTPPTLARRAGVAREKIIAAINRGELRAINLSDGTRPRWRVAEEDWQAWLDSKSNQKPAKESRRQTKKPAVIEFYK